MKLGPVQGFQEGYEDPGIRGLSSVHSLVVPSFNEVNPFHIPESVGIAYSCNSPHSFGPVLLPSFYQPDNRIRQSRSLPFTMYGGIWWYPRDRSYSGTAREDGYRHPVPDEKRLQYACRIQQQQYPDRAGQGRSVPGRPGLQLGHG